MKSKEKKKLITDKIKITVVGF